MKRYTKLCRIITHGITSSGGTTPRAALITAIREQYKLRKRWRANSTRQPGESEEGEGTLSLEVIKEMAREGRCPVSIKIGGCSPWYPETRWDVPKEYEYADTPEVDFQRFVAGVVDAIEASDRWDDFKIENIQGQAPGKGSKYRNAIVSLASVMLLGVPNPSWKDVQ